MDPRVKLVMGDLCKDCYKSMAYILWYNDDETIEYTVRSFEVITGLSTDILEERKNNLKNFEPGFKDWYNDLDAHKAWQSGDHVFVHCLHSKYTTEVIRLVKFDGVFFVVDREVCGFSGDGRSNNKQVTFTPQGSEEQENGTGFQGTLPGRPDSLAWLLQTLSEPGEEPNVPV